MVLFLQRLGCHHDWLDKAIPNHAVTTDRPAMSLSAHLLQLWTGSHPQIWSVQGRLAHPEARALLQPLGRQWL